MKEQSGVTRSWTVQRYRKKPLFFFEAHLPVVYHNNLIFRYTTQKTLNLTYPLRVILV